MSDADTKDGLSLRARAALATGFRRITPTPGEAAEGAVEHWLWERPEEETGDGTTRISSFECPALDRPGYLDFLVRWVEARRLQVTIHRYPLSDGFGWMVTLCEGGRRRGEPRVAAATLSAALCRAIVAFAETEAGATDAGGG